MAKAPPKPAGWKKPEKHYGGASPGVIEGPHGDQPDLLTIGAAIVYAVTKRKEKITTPGYCMKVRDSCPYSCCQYLQGQEEEDHQQKIIIKKIIRKRRSKQQVATTAQAQSPNPQAASQAAAQRQWQEAEQRRQQELLRQQQEEAERQRQLAEQQRRQQEEAERQRQAAAAAAPPALPTQKVAIFQNTGTDPAMAKAELYYESTRWGPLGHGDPPVSVGTFPGHRWFIVANGMYAKLFTVGEEAQQTFTF